MKNQPKVSIIIPVFNGSNFLKKAITTALAQTYQNIEVLVIDDGSNDQGKSKEIALSFGDQIKFFQKENDGVASALNFGINKMQGDYFSWLSHDDEYYPDKVEKQINAILKLPSKTIVYSNFELIDSHSKVLKTYHLTHIKPHNFLKELICYSNINGCTLLIPKEALVLEKGFNESILTAQDYQLWFRLNRSYNFVHLCQVLVKQRIHNDQDSQKKKNLCDIEQENLLKTMIEEYLYHQKSIVFFKNVADILIMMQYRKKYVVRDLTWQLAFKRDFSLILLVFLPISFIKNSIRFLKLRIRNSL